MDVLRLIQENDDYQIIVRCDDIGYVWERFKGRINYANSSRGHDIVAPDKYCNYASSDSGSLYLYNCEEGKLMEVMNDKRKQWNEVWPVVYETCDYNIAIRFKQGFVDKGTEPCVRHVRRDVESLFYVDRLYDGEEVIGLSGTISFVNEPGVFKLEFEYQHGGRKYVAWLTFDVVSPKLDIKTDYKTLLNDVNEEYNNVIFRYLSTTYQQLARGREKNDVVWMTTFENIIADYLKNVEIIIHRPHQKVRNYTTYVKAEQIKKWSPALEDEYEEKRLGKRLEDYYFEYKDSETTINTKENRFVKYTLCNIASRLNHILEDVLKQDCNNNLSEKHRQELTNYRCRLQKLVKHPFFKMVGKFEGLSQDSLVLQNRLGYQQVYKDWIKLNRGIDLYKGASNIGTLQIWEIYELWCFIKMKRMIKQLLHIDSSDYENLVSEPKGSLFNPFTNSKMEHIVRFEYPVPPEDDESEWAKRMRAHRGDVVTLHYQHTFNRLNNDDYGVHTATTEQRPDVVLNIEKKDGAGILLTYLYDAKYRVISDRRLDKDEMDIADEDDLIKGADLPPRDAINQMHRYRDAIYYGQDKYTQSSKEIIGGYILFPGRGNDNSVAERYYTKSIKSVNIGAFPLSPGEECTLLRQHLEQIITQQSAYEQIKDSIPQKGLKYHAATDDVKILVGYFDNLEKLLMVQYSGWYNVRVGAVKGSISLTNELLNARYLLLYHESERYLYELVSDGPKIWSKEEVIDAFDTAWKDVVKKHQDVSVERKDEAMPDKNLYMMFKLASNKEVKIDGLNIDEVKITAIHGAPYVTSLSDIMK